MIHSKTYLLSINYTADRISTLQTEDSIGCICGKIFIGETGRNISYTLQRTAMVGLLKTKPTLALAEHSQDFGLLILFGKTPIIFRGLSEGGEAGNFHSVINKVALYLLPLL